MFNFSRIRDFFSGLVSKFWDNKNLYNNLMYVEDLTTKVGPYIKIAGDIAVGMIPGNVDDAVWDNIKKKYPKLFDGTVIDREMTKLYALGIATDLIENRFPEVTTTVARTAVQIAYLIEKSK